MYVRRLAYLLSAALIGSCLILPAFGKTPTTKAVAGPTLIWRGDVTTAHGVVTDMAKAWESAGHGKIELQPFNTASGIDAVATGTADLAGSARGSDGSAQNTRLTFTPVAWDGLVMVTQASNPISNLTLKQLHDIYYGKITNWKDVGGRDAPIDLYAVASPGDGVEYSLRSLLFGRGNQPVAAPRLYLNTNQLGAGVALNPNGLGVTTLAEIAGNRTSLKTIPINGVAPTAANLANGSYVLYTPIYLITNPTSPKVAEAQAFIDFVDSDAGKAALRRHGILPYQDGLVLASMDGSRRTKILAETGAHASGPLPTITTPSATRVAEAAAPAAALASRSTAVAAATKTDLSGVTSGVVAAPEPSSLKGVTGDAITVAGVSSRGADFAKVTSDVVVTHNRVIASKKAERVVQATPVATAAPVANKVVAKKAVAVKEAKASKSAITYRVAAGETLYSIARKHSVDVAQVRAWNHLKDDTVRPGQVLRVSAR
ncbi:MAG: substrate-binding domain-containing protein [Rhodanobacter sp.]